MDGSHIFFTSGVALIVFSILAFCIVFALFCLFDVPNNFVYTVKRFGKFSRYLSPGINLIIPFAERVVARVSTEPMKVRVTSYNIETRDNFSLTIEANLLLRVYDPLKVSSRNHRSPNNFEFVASSALKYVFKEINMEQIEEFNENANSKIKKALRDPFRGLGFNLLEFNWSYEGQKENQINSSANIPEEIENTKNVSINNNAEEAKAIQLRREAEARIKAVKFKQDLQESSKQQKPELAMGSALDVEESIIEDDFTGDYLYGDESELKAFHKISNLRIKLNDDESNANNNLSDLMNNKRDDEAEQTELNREIAILEQSASGMNDKSSKQYEKVVTQSGFTCYTNTSLDNDNSEKVNESKPKAKSKKSEKAKKSKKGKKQSASQPLEVQRILMEQQHNSIKGASNEPPEVFDHYMDIYKGISKDSKNEDYDSSEKK